MCHDVLRDAQEMHAFAKVVYHHPDGVTAPADWELGDEVHGDHLPTVVRDVIGHESWDSFRADGAVRCMCGRTAVELVDIRLRFDFLGDKRRRGPEISVLLDAGMKNGKCGRPNAATTVASVNESLRPFDWRCTYYMSCFSICISVHCCPRSIQRSGARTCTVISICKGA